MLVLLDTQESGGCCIRGKCQTLARDLARTAARPLHPESPPLPTGQSWEGGFYTAKGLLNERGRNFRQIGDNEEHDIWNLDRMIHNLHHTLIISLLYLWNQPSGINSCRIYLPASELCRLFHRSMEISPFSYSL